MNKFGLALQLICNCLLDSTSCIMDVMVKDDMTTEVEQLKKKFIGESNKGEYIFHNQLYALSTIQPILAIYDDRDNSIKELIENMGDQFLPDITIKDIDNGTYIYIFFDERIEK